MTEQAQAHGAVPGRFQAAYRVLNDAIAARAFPGCAFGVLAGGEVQLQDALGRFTYEDHAPAVTPETVFDLASVTKVAATTAAAMLLVQRGQLDIDAALADYLPAFAAGRGAGDPALHIALRHLLAHNSGLPGYVEFFRTQSTPDALLRACSRLPLQAHPGARDEYSDPGFILLGKALEAAMGESLDSWTKREIFDPLAMNATRFCPQPAARPSIPPTEEDARFRHRRIQGEVQDENAWVLGGVAGHAGLFSNVPDLLRFSAAILDAATLKEHDFTEPLKGHGPTEPLKGHGFSRAAQIPRPLRALALEASLSTDAPAPVSGLSKDREPLFSLETVERFSQPQSPAGSSRALGWDTPSENSSSGKHFFRRSIGHLGYSGCSLWIDLESAVAVVLLTNRTWPDRSCQLIRQVRPAFHNAVREAL